MLFRRFRFDWTLCIERIFCRFLFSLHRTLNKTTVLQQDRFFPARHHKYAFKTTKDVPSKTLLTMSYMLTSCSFSGSRYRKNRNEKPKYSLQGQSIVAQLFLQICLPTVFGERALPLHILKLLGHPRQGPLSVLATVCPASLSPKTPFSVVQME